MKLPFSFDDNIDITVKEIISSPLTWIISVTGQTEWAGAERSVRVRSSRKIVRDAKFSMNPPQFQYGVS